MLSVEHVPSSWHFASTYFFPWTTAAMLFRPRFLNSPARRLGNGKSWPKAKSSKCTFSGWP